MNRPLLVLRADVREAEEAERLRLPEPACLASLGGEAAELDQARRTRSAPRLILPSASLGVGTPDCAAQ
jgi:hypothetical protein